MASPNISFDQIPASIRKPGKYFEFNTKLAVRTLPGNLQKTVIVAQMLSSGTATVNTVVEVFSDAQAALLYGRGSIAHLMVKAAIKAYPYLALSVVAVADAGAGVAATGSVAITGPASAPGVFTIKIGSERVDVAVASGDTATQIGAAVVAQIDQQPDLPVTATANLGTVTVTARHKGTLGNGIKLSHSTTAPGVSAVTTAMASGATDPDITTALTAIFSAGHNVVISAYNDQTNLTALRTHLDNTGGPLEQRGAVGIYGHVGSLANATTLAGTINSGRISGCLLPGTLSQACELAAAYGAVVASEEDPARPLNLLALTGIAAPEIPDRLGRVEQENALYNGVTPLEVGPGERVQIVRAITTYTQDPQGIDDISLLDLTTIRTLDYVRKACRERISLRFPREKLSARTPPKVRSELLDVLLKLEELEIVEEVEANKDGLLVERDLQDPNRLNAKIPTDVVNGLHVFAGRIDLLL